MDAETINNLAMVGSAAIGLAGAIWGVYCKNSQNKYVGLLGESMAFLQDLSMTVAEIRDATKDGVITPSEVEQISLMADDLELHVAKIQSELNLKA